MFEKSQLEKDIEQREFVKRPSSIFVLIAILFICLGILGAYTWKLQQELLVKEQEIASIKNSCYQEKTDLQNIVRKLEKENEKLRDNLSTQVDDTKTTSSAAADR
ncbi:MAG TPA: hypothetical protein ENH40_04980 [Nitrospirae bacterium]|nr:hypothetical protein [Nitrospirota bacterium]